MAEAFLRTATVVDIFTVDGSVGRLVAAVVVERTLRAAGVSHAQQQRPCTDPTIPTAYPSGPALPIRSTRGPAPAQGEPGGDGADGRGDRGAGDSAQNWKDLAGGDNQNRTSPEAASDVRPAQLVRFIIPARLLATPASEA